MTITDGDDLPLDPRSIALRRSILSIVTASVSLPLFGFVALLVWLAPLPGWGRMALAALWASLTGLLGWFAMRWPELSYRHASYRVDHDGIAIRRGVVWRHAIHVPRARVQHTDVSQGPLERGHGLATLVIHTAGTGYAVVPLGGIDHATAMALRDHLLPGSPDDAV